MGEIRDKVRRLSNNSYLKLQSKEHLCWNNLSAHNFPCVTQCWGFVRNDDDTLRIAVLIATYNVRHGKRWPALWLFGPR